MPAPSLTVKRGDRGPVQTAPGDVSTRFDVVISERGPVGVPIDSRSWGMRLQRLGGHTSYSTGRATEEYFKAGGGRSVEARVVGPAARTAVLALRDAASATVLTVTAEGPGPWYHGLRVLVTRGTGNDRVITVSLNGSVLSTGTARDADGAVAIIEAAGYGLTAPLGAGTWPIDAIADTALAGGDDDRANITQREVDTALDVFALEAIEHTPGSLCASAWTTVACHTSLARRAAATNRFARGDMPDIASAATLTAAAAQIRALDDAEHIQLLAGNTLVNVAGTTVPVPASGALCGREARTDRENREGPGQPCAWTFGDLDTVVGVTQSWSRADRDALVDAGITPIVQDADTGKVWALDAITAADPGLYPQYAEVSGMRVTMAIQNESRLVLKQRVMQSIDGHGHLAAAAKGDLVAIGRRWYDRDALYGDTFEEAFSADVLADGTAGSLTGNESLRPTRSAKRVELSITEVASGDTI